MVCPTPEQQASTNLTGQHDINAFAAHEIHDSKDRLTSLLILHHKFWHQTESEVIPKMMVS